MFPVYTLHICLCVIYEYLMNIFPVIFYVIRFSVCRILNSIVLLIFFFYSAINESSIQNCACSPDLQLYQASYYFVCFLYKYSLIFLKPISYTHFVNSLWMFSHQVFVLIWLYRRRDTWIYTTPLSIVNYNAFYCCVHIDITYVRYVMKGIYRDNGHCCLAIL